MPRGDFQNPALYDQIAARTTDDPGQPRVPAGQYDPGQLFTLPSDRPDYKPQQEFIYPSERPGYRREQYNPNDLFILPSEAAEQARQQAEADSFTGMAAQTLMNVPRSAYDFGAGIAHTVMHPIQTAQTLGDVGLGVLEKIGVKPGSEHEQYADAVGKFFMDRYGGWDNLKKTIVHDPVGFLADASTVLSGGAGVAARVPMTAGRIAEGLGTAARMTNPLAAPAAAITGTGRAIGKLGAEGFGLATGTGPEAMKTAARAGYEGGEAAQAFREQMRGSVPLEGVAEDAMTAVQNIRRKRGELYREQMAELGADRTVLPFDKIDEALAEVTKVKTFRGVPINDKTQAIRQEIGQTIAEWKQLPAADFHTPEGLDALKQKVGSIREATAAGTPERKVASDAYRAIRSTIITQAPEYKNIMAAYEKSSNLLNDLEKTLSLNEAASADTILRKLQSVLRDNVNTAYGHRAQLAQYLIDNGSPYLLHALAGQTLKPWTARGLGKLAQQLGAMLVGGGFGGAAFAGGAGLLGTGATGLAAALPVLAGTSPRLMGEAAYYSGRAAGLAGRGVGAAAPYAPSAAIAGREQVPRADGGGIPFNTQRASARQLVRNGLLHSNVAGRTDKLNIKTPSGAYVIPADVVSGAGQGNTLNGATALKNMFSTGPLGMKTLKGGSGRAGHAARIGTTKLPKGSKISSTLEQTFADGGPTGDEMMAEEHAGEPTPIDAAGGEYLIHPSIVRRLGRGDLKQGHKVLDAFVLYAREQIIKQMEELKPPVGSHKEEAGRLPAIAGQERQ